MTLKQALQEICESQIPKEINGVRTKFIIHECKTGYGEVFTEVTLLPVHVRKDNIGVTQKYSDNYYINYDFCYTSLGYKAIKRDIEELLCLYIRNIISYFQGEVIETRVISVNSFKQDGEQNVR